MPKKLVKPPKDFLIKVRIPINGIYKIKGVGDVITGRIEQGTLPQVILYVLFQEVWIIKGIILKCIIKHGLMQNLEIISV